MDGEIEADVLVGSGGALRYDAVRRLLVYAEGDLTPVEVVVGEADLRTWMQVLLLSSFAPADTDRATVRAARLVLEVARAHVRRGEDPFTPLRARLARAASRRPPLAG